MVRDDPDLLAELERVAVRELDVAVLLVELDERRLAAPRARARTLPRPSGRRRAPSSPRPGSRGCVAGRLTTVAQTVSATSSSVAAPAAIVARSWKAYVPARYSVTVGSELVRRPHRRRAAGGHGLDGQAARVPPPRRRAARNCSAPAGDGIREEPGELERAETGRPRRRGRRRRSASRRPCARGRCRTRRARAARCPERAAAWARPGRTRASSTATVTAARSSSPREPRELVLAEDVRRHEQVVADLRRPSSRPRRWSGR